ncbi:hypothetical protein E3V25_06675 [Streptococcus pseudopneumoniae]|nr:hypothetical protein [Streptococcus pseudopneumoniae]TMR52447.1 hypothetical protein E3V25_06675 [Streptococcus pseudopneumoniae]TMR52891.1 hypothetical protein E3V31_03935 [Streptococcus pseudopneumoniae]
MKSIQLNMNETKKYLVIKAIIQGKKTNNRTCGELNLSERQINRLLLAYQQKGKEVYFIRKTKAFVIKAFDGDSYLNIADKIYHTKELLVHELYSKNFEPEPEQKKKDASISLHKPIRGNSHLSNNIFRKIKRIMKSLLVRSLILLIYKYKLFLAKWEAVP